MIVLLLASFAALALPVECDAGAASTLLADARLSEARAPVTHAELIPGLALGSSRAEPALRDALHDLCGDPRELSIAPGEAWQGPDWTARTFLLSRTESVGCALRTRSIAISVAMSAGAAPTYKLRSVQPVAHTPVGACSTAAVWRDERVVDGGEGPVRVVLARNLQEGEVISSEVLVRRATRDGWVEQVLMTPAPARYIGGGGGPKVELLDDGGDTWVVVHADRTGAPPECAPIAGQVVWTWDAEGRTWRAHEGRDSLALLAQRGAWRMAGEDGWFHILAVEDATQSTSLLDQLQARLQRRSAEPLQRWDSSRFPGLNPDFWVITPDPYRSRSDAETAQRSWRSLRRSYVKQAWTAPDSCAADAG